MKPRFRFLLLAAALSAATVNMTAPPAHAIFGVGDIVLDPANLAQNILTALNTLEQIDHQIDQLTHEITMLENMARDLQSMPDSIADALRDRIFRVDDLIRMAEGIGYSVDYIDEEYERLYRESYGGEPPPSSVILDDARQAWRQSRSGYKHALEVQAQIVGNVREDVGRLHGLIGSSQGAAGNLQALQAGNQIAAFSAEQLMQTQTLIAAQYRAEALDRSQALSERERGRARLVRFLGDGSAYAPGG